LRARPEVVGGLALLTLGSVLFDPTRPASAEPQMSVGLTVGGGAADLRTTPRAVFHLGIHGDVLFFRKRDRDMAFGPYVEALTAAFDTFEVGGGVSWLIPVTETVPFVLSAGAHARGGVGGWFPGVSTTLWGGSRSLNFDSIYGLAIGLFVQGRYGFGDARQADVIGGLQIDGEVFALPFLLLANAFR
jgi:hypothetical protein